MMEGFKLRMEELAVELVRTRSVVGTEGEADITAWIYGWLSKLPYFAEHPEGLIVERLAGDRLGRSCLIATIRANPESKDALLLLGHTDTAGTSDYAAAEPCSTDPARLPGVLSGMKLGSSASEDLASGDYVFGRGIFDMKAGVAALMLIAEMASCNGSRLGDNLVFSFVPDEEGGSAGMIASVQRLSDMARDEGWEFMAALDTDYMTEGFPGDASRYVYLGTVGKLLPCVYIHGEATHVGEAFCGIDANLLAAAVMSSIDLDPGLSDIVEGEVTQPPISLRMQDLKEEYSVQTTDGAFLYFNFPTHSSTPDIVMEKMRAKVEKAVGDAVRDLSLRRERHAALSGRKAVRPYATPRVITYSELLKEAEAALGRRLAGIVQEYKSGHGFTRQDPREASLGLVREIHRLLPDQSPMAVLFFSPPYYPHICVEDGDRKGAQLAKAVGLAVAEAREKLGYEIAIKKFYPYISDLSYCRLPSEEGALTALVSNMPAWPEAYELPLDAISALSMPVANIGPFGKDAHKPTERLSRAYSLDAMPLMVLRTIEELTGSRIIR